MWSETDGEVNPMAILVTPDSLYSKDLTASEGLSRRPQSVSVLTRKDQVK